LLAQEFCRAEIDMKIDAILVVGIVVPVIEGDTAGGGKF